MHRGAALAISVADEPQPIPAKLKSRSAAVQLPDLAADLIRRRVAVIATPGSTPAALAAKAATTTIPIVFLVAGDPIALGLVASLNLPGSNATGVNFQLVELVTKRLGMLREIAPGSNRFVALVNPNSAYTEVEVKDLQANASALGLPIEILRAGTGREIDAAFANLAQKSGGALLVAPDAFFISRRAQIVTLAARHAIPAIYPTRDFAEIGGLMSYGPSLADAYHQIGTYVGRVLKGEKPAVLPVVQPSHRRLRDRKAELEQLAMNARRTPKHILNAHSTDQSP